MAKRAKNPQSDLTRSHLASNVDQIDLHTFTKALVASLVKLDVDAVSPHSTRDRRGFHSVVKLLDKQLERLRREGMPPPTLLSVAKVVNELRASDVGSYEGFEAAFRSLQLTFTSSPNPFYDDIAFPISKMQADSFIQSVPAFERSLALSAAKAFVAERKRETA